MLSGELRQRGRPLKGNRKDKKPSNGSSDSSPGSEQSNDQPLQCLHWLLVSIFLIVMFIVGASFETSCENVPWPTVDDKDSKIEFQESIARGHLWNLTKMGPHTVGSKANEVDIPNFLKGELSKYNGKSFGHLYAEMDEQVSGFGSFTMENILGPGNTVHLAYQNIRNIVFRISSKQPPRPNEKRSGILINCHYDSFVGSPGATDDAVSCASMLETIRVILERRPTMQHDLFFLFNGAEEVLLMASHAFVTQHRWMKDVGMFINLEGAGAGGRQLVFQTGPGNPWIIEEYARNARQPFASIMGAEVFGSGLVLADTDFRIFRDYGGIPGMDLAYISNGHIYHTSNDDEKRIPPSCLRNSGENLVSILNELITSPHVGQNNDVHMQRLVFFDVLGLFMITYSETWYYYINLSIIFTVFFRAFLRVHKNPGHFRFLRLAILNQILTAVGFSLVLLGTGTCMHYLVRRMTWYSLRSNIVGIYLLPVVLYCFAHHGYFVKRMKIWPTPALAEKSHFDATQIIVCSVLLLVTFLDFLSGYVLLPWIIFPFIGDILKIQIKKVFRLKWKDWKAQLVYPLYTLLIIGVAYIYNVYMSQVLLDVFLPILGRAGSAVSPDIIVGVILIVPIIIPTMYLTCDIYLTKPSSVFRIQTFVLHLFISYLALVAFTPMGFPFDGSEVDPKQHRMVIAHCTFTHRDHLGNVESTDNKLLFSSLDMSGVHPISDVYPDLKHSDLKVFTCNKLPYCGFPHLYPIASILEKIYYLPLDREHNVKPAVGLKILRKAAINDTTYNVTMSILGPSLSYVYLMTEDGVDLLRWSFDPKASKPPLISVVPRTTSEKHYFIKNIYGTLPKKPLEFWALFNVDNSLPNEKAEVGVALTGFYQYQDGHVTKEMKEVIDRLPPWVSEIHWSATYDLSVIRLRN